MKHWTPADAMPEKLLLHYVHLAHSTNFRNNMNHTRDLKKMLHHVFFFVLSTIHSPFSVNVVDSRAMRINSFYVMLVIFCVAGAGLLALWRRALPGFIFGGTLHKT
jgi:hypothetical protein